MMGNATTSINDDNVYRFIIRFNVLELDWQTSTSNK